MNNVILLQQRIRDFFNQEDGIGSVEMVLILFVLVGIVMIFKQNIETMVGNYLNNMDPNFTHPPTK